MDEHNEQVEHEINFVKKFSHKNYAFKVTILIIVTYFLIGIILSLLDLTVIPKSWKQDFNIYTQGAIQIIFLLLPVIYFSKRALLPFNVILRQKHFPAHKQIIAGIAGIIIFQVAASSFMVIQEKLIPSQFLDLYKQLED